MGEWHNPVQVIVEEVDACIKRCSEIMRALVFTLYRPCMPLSREGKFGTL